jgi:hypothetical protein
MNSKEEILKKHCTIFNEGIQTEWVDSPPKRIYAAMDEYRSIGEQEMAIKFKKWCDKEGWVWNAGKNLRKGGVKNSIYFSYESVYELFKQSL